MLHLLAKKSTSGEMSVNLAEHYLANHEWGLAKQAIEEALSKSGLLDMDHALRLLGDVCLCMGVSVDSSDRNIAQ